MRRDYEILGIEDNSDEKAIKRAYFKLIRTYSPEKDPERFQEIRAAYERLMEETKQPENVFKLEMPKDDKFAMSMFDQIQQLMHEDDYSAAARTAKEGMKYYNDAECFLYMYARCTLMEGSSGKAVKAYEQLAKKYPDKVYYKSELAKAYNMRGYSRKAIAMFNEAYALGAREIDFLFEYSMCAVQLCRYDEAVQALKDVIASVPETEILDMMPELMEAYMALLMMYMQKPFAFSDIADSCLACLEKAAGRVREYQEMLQPLYMLVQVVATQSGSKEIGAIGKKLGEMLPEMNLSEEIRAVDEAYAVLEDERFGQAIKITVKAFMHMDETISYDGFSKEYESFIQQDALLCLIEEWPKQKAELEILKREYPMLYECGIDVWRMLKMGREQLYWLKQDILAEYVQLERKYHCGHYYELYPHRRQPVDQIQWDSQGNGTFMRGERKIGRNEPCFCGSGKKYKNCCGKNA